jgi:hypothetical protein
MTILLLLLVVGSYYKFMKRVNYYKNTIVMVPWSTEYKVRPFLKLEPDLFKLLQYSWILLLL